MLPVGWVMGALDFCFLWPFPPQQQKDEGWRGGTCQLSVALVPFGEGGRAVGGWPWAGRGWQEDTGVTSLSLLLDPCREADQPEVLLCSFRPIFTVSEQICPLPTHSLRST